MDSRVQQVLTHLISRAKDEVGTFSALADAFEEKAASIGLKREYLSRRQLRKIANGEDIPIRCSQWQVIDEYFRSRGVSFSSLLSQPYLANAIAECGRILFITGSQPDSGQRRIDLSRWDIRAIRRVLEAIPPTPGRGMRVAIEDVIFRKNSHKTFSGGTDPVPQNETWYHRLEDKETSVVCIGSPKACHASEVMLARMFGVEPFKEWPDSKIQPYFFVWGDGRASRIRSAFKKSAKEAAGLVDAREGFVSDVVGGKGKYSALVYENQLYEVNRCETPWKTYGVVTAQRRSNNSVWVCLSGLTGPATLAAAECLSSVTAELGWIEPSSPVTVVVEVTINDLAPQSGQEYRRDERRIVKWKVVDSTSPFSVST